jgi:hypothetical protein
MILDAISVMSGRLSVTRDAPSTFILARSAILAMNNVLSSDDALIRQEIPFPTRLALSILL